MFFRSLDHSKTIWIVAILFIAVSVFVWLGNHKTVSLGEEFTLRQGQTASISGTDLRITLVRILKDCRSGGSFLEICPSGIVEYEYEGQKIKSISENIPYDVVVVESQEEYMVYIVYRAGDCATRGDQCWESAAYRFKNLEACGKIEDNDRQRDCYEALAAYYLKERAHEICSYVSDPRQYCLLLKAVSANDINLCRNVGLGKWGPSTQPGWKDTCFGTILRNNQNNLELCNQVGTVDYKRCREAPLYLERMENWVERR